MTKNKSYFRMQVTVLRMCGVSLREDDSLMYKIISYILLPYTCAYPFIAAGDLFKHDFETVADLLSYEFPIFVGVIKTIAVILKRKKISKVLNELDGHISLQKYASGNRETEELLKNCLLITTIQTAAYWTIAFFSYFFAFVYTLSSRIRSSDYNDWLLSYGKITILDITRSPDYEITWGYQTSAVGFIAILFTTIDILIATVFCHICFHLRIVQHNIRRAAADIHNETERGNKANMSAIETTEFKGTEMEWDRLHMSLKRRVEYHLAIINIIKEVNDSFSSLLLLVFLGTLGMLSFLAYKASLVPLNDVRMLRSFGELGTVVLQVLMFCFWSDEMVFQGKQVGYAAYEALIVGTDLRFQKSLIMIMARSQYPVKITAGFVEVSLATFTWILRSTYSYYMILRKKNLREAASSFDN